LKEYEEVSWIYEYEDTRYSYAPLLKKGSEGPILAKIGDSFIIQIEGVREEHPRRVAYRTHWTTSETSSFLGFFQNTTVTNHYQNKEFNSFLPQLYKNYTPVLQFRSSYTYGNSHKMQSGLLFYVASHSGELSLKELYRVGDSLETNAQITPPEQTRLHQENPGRSILSCRISQIGYVRGLRVKITRLRYT
jgi:hypothetical protein